MLHMDDHADDPYMVDFFKRYDAGEVAPIDRANAAVERAGQALTVFSETASETEKLAQEEALARAVRCAYLTAKAEALEEDGLAETFAQGAEREALTLDSFDAVRLEGLRRAEPFAEVRRARLQ